MEGKSQTAIDVTVADNDDRPPAHRRRPSAGGGGKTVHHGEEQQHDDEDIGNSSTSTSSRRRRRNIIVVVVVSSSANKISRGVAEKVMEAQQRNQRLDYHCSFQWQFNLARLLVQMSPFPSKSSSSFSSPSTRTMPRNVI